VLELLHGLPLALTQAGSYMRETNMSALTYAKHYDRTWGRLMKGQDRFPLEEYGDRSVLTTWTMSYGQVQRQSDEAAWLLKLWGFLDSGEVWYELIAAGADLAAEMDIPACLLAVAENELAFAEAMGLLSRYSLAEGKEGTGSHSMHSVLHRWCRYQADDEERYKLGCLAVGLVASHVPSEFDAEFWKKRKRLMAHGLHVSGWIGEDDRSDEQGVVEASIRPGDFYNLGYLLCDEDKQQAERMYQRALAGCEKTWGREHMSTLDTVNNLGVIYKELGRMEKAEQMLQRALEGYEKACGREHTSTLATVNNLGLLYRTLGRLEEAEQMLQRALAGYEKAYERKHTWTLDIVNNLGLLYMKLGRLEEAEQMLQRALDGYATAFSAHSLSTHVPALNNMWNLAFLRKRQGYVDEARHWYSQALRGYEKTVGQDHSTCLLMRTKLAEIQ
jgi:tetratricopeptide (TPR) repeat protein